MPQCPGIFTDHPGKLHGDSATTTDDLPMLHIEIEGTDQGYRIYARVPIKMPIFII
jgi:hypothetical protein